MKYLWAALMAAVLPGSLAADTACTCNNPRPLLWFSEDPLIEPQDDGLVPVVHIDPDTCSGTITFQSGDAATYDLDGSTYLKLNIMINNEVRPMTLDEAHAYGDTVCANTLAASS